MENRLNHLKRYARNATHRAGLHRFWRWWMSELAPLVPEASRSTIRRRLTRPIIEFGAAETVFWRPDVVDGSLELVAVASVPQRGEAAEIAAAGRAAVNAVTAGPQGAATTSPRLVVALPPSQVLRKTIVLPAAVEENLTQALAYDLDRHTPFRPEQLYFDAAVIDRDVLSKTIRVDWAAALKTAVDAARRQAEEWGAVVVAVVPGPASTAGSRLNLIPEDARPGRMLWRRWDIWAPVALVALVALAVVIVPLLQKREYAIALNQQTESARGSAEIADALRTQFERQQGDYNYVLAKKYAYPSSVQMLDEVTKLLPDDTWISNFEMKTAVRGKDLSREMLLRGESFNAGKLISLLEDSKLVEQVALRSPTNKLQPGPGEVFDLGSQVRPVPPPASAQAAGPPATAAPTASDAPATAPPAATPASPPTSSATSTAPGPTTTTPAKSPAQAPPAAAFPPPGPSAPPSPFGSTQPALAPPSGLGGSR